MIQISIVGTGYVGLVTAACLADKGHRVTCVDLDAARVAQINRGETPFYEGGLDDLLQRNIGHNLSATSDLARAVRDSAVTFITVGTPTVDSAIDLSQLERAAGEIGAAIKDKNDYHMVAVKSTVLPGTTEGLVLEALERHSGKKAGTGFGLGMNPEFLREGAAVADFMYPDRIVMGSYDARSAEELAAVYAVFPTVTQLPTSIKTAEMIKYTSNSLLATMISFSNEIANLCSAVGGVDILDVMQGVHLDRRLSPQGAQGERIRPDFLEYLEAGCGFGGSCFPKDLQALINFGDRTEMPMRLLKSVVAVNRDQPERIITLLKRHFTELEDLRVTVLGLAFKPGTDDIRESPALTIIQRLLELGVNVCVYDPVATANARAVFGDTVKYGAELETALADAQAVLVITRWEEFQRLPEIIAAMSTPPLVIDGRRILAKDSFSRYDGIGL